MGWGGVDVLVGVAGVVRWAPILINRIEPYLFGGSFTQISTFILNFDQVGEDISTFITWIAVLVACLAPREDDTPMKLWMITGSATDDGAPIYLQPSGRWTHTLGAAFATEDAEERDALLELARGQQRLVCDPYAIPVQRTELGHLAARSLKERIRSAGPTISMVEEPPASYPVARAAGA